MKHYELMYIVPIKMGAEESTATQDKVRDMLTGEGAKITMEESLGKRKLAYPIEHVRHGSYVLTEFDVEQEKLGKIQDWFRLSPEILRSQIVAKQLKSPEQLAREKAFQEKLQRKHAAEESAESEAQVATQKSEPTETHAKPKVQLEELDKTLEKILKQEIVN